MENQNYPNQPDGTQQTPPPINPQPQRPNMNPFMNPFTSPNTPPPSNYMVGNIIATIIGFMTCWICCVGGFIGIVGIVFSSQVNKKALMGDYEGALSSSKTAKILMIVSFVITALSFIYLIISTIIAIASGETSLYETFMEEFQRGFEEGYERGL